MVLALLNVVPDKLIGNPESVLPGECGILTCRIIVYSEPLSAFAADNGFHENSILDGGCPAQTSGHVKPQETLPCSVHLSKRLPV